MSQPLSGLRIADFSHVMAGPFASHLLRLMGAEVIKIEPAAGDGFRNYGADRRFDGIDQRDLAVRGAARGVEVPGRQRRGKEEVVHPHRAPLAR